MNQPKLLNKGSICLFTNNVSPGIANLIRIIENTEKNFHVITDKKCCQPLADHDLCYPLIRNFKKNNLHSHSTKINIKWSLLLFTWAHWVPYNKEQLKTLTDEIKKANKIILLYDASFGTSFKRLVAQIRDTIRFRHIFSSINEICYLTEMPTRDIFSLNKKKFPYHASPMQAFVFDKNLSKRLFQDYNPNEKRSYDVTVAGTDGPDLRIRVYNELNTYIRAHKNISIIENIQKERPDNNSKSIFWAVGKNTLKFDDYFNVMRNSDFVFCLPGTYWTPRPIESTACGAIPIIGDDYLHSYDIPFQDGRNCIIIENCENISRWSKALERVLNLSKDQILEMRYNIHCIRESHLLPETYVRRQRKRFRCEKS